MVARQISLAFDERDLRGQSDCAEQIAALAQAELQHPFDLARPPLMRFAVIHTLPAQHHFIFTHHHLLTDGWSTAQLIAEVLQHYRTQTLPALHSRYRDYIQWLQQRDVRASERYWKTQLQRLEEPTRLTSALPTSVGGEGYIQYVQELDTAISHVW